MNAAVRWLHGGRAESPPPVTGTYKEERITPEDALRLLAGKDADKIISGGDVVIVGSEGRPWKLSASVHPSYPWYVGVHDWCDRRRCIDSVPGATRNREKSAFAVTLGIQADEQNVQDMAGYV